MWRLWHKLFGWHYVHLQNSADDIIRRVHLTASGEPYVVYYVENLIFLRRPGGWTVTLLTAARDQDITGEEPR